MVDQWKLDDEYGPEKILHVYNQAAGLKGIVVVDNTSAGPSIGGVRMAADVSLEECARLARAMTFKNAAAGLPHGGGKSVIFADPKLDPATKERIIRAFAVSIKDLVDYIPGPDMGTNEECMAWVRDEIGRSVGLPLEVGGIPLDEIGATGFGLVASIEAALDYCDISLDTARVALQGFGSVGQHAARFLSEKGATLVGAGDSKGTVVNPGGLDVSQLVEYKRNTGTVCGYQYGETRSTDAILDVDCDIWVPAARPDVVHAENAHRLNTRLIAEGANIPITLDAERALAERGVTIIPDFIANAGGVICASTEYHGGTKTDAFSSIKEKIGRNTVEMFEMARSRNIVPRLAATELARNRLLRAMSFSRW
jgi:glutamate dehydrogenase (NAD(P)+)